ncbi:MAG: hypothetical protein ACJASQ_002408 [Crocinitomicaceae bacterium]
MTYIIIAGIEYFEHSTLIPLNNGAFLFTLSIFSGIPLLIAFILHIYLLLINLNRTIIIIDRHEGSIISILGKTRTEYRISSIKSVLLIYCETNSYTSSTLPIIWKNYSYLRIEFENGGVLFVSSLMHNLSPCPIVPTKRIGKIIPSFSTPSEVTEKDQSNEILELHKKNFKKLSDTELEERISNTSYTEEA